MPKSFTVITTGEDPETDEYLRDLLGEGGRNTFPENIGDCVSCGIQIRSNCTELNCPSCGTPIKLRLIRTFDVWLSDRQ